MLKYNQLGNSGLSVSEFCLGLLPMGPLQANMKESEMVEIIEKAIEYGVNFVDTAEMYGTQSALGKAIKGQRSKVVISTKSQSASYDDMARSFEKSLRELGTDYIDIFNLHAAKATSEVFEQRKGALRFLIEMKEQKVLHAVGISTHNVQIVKLAGERDDIDVIFPLVNISGYGILEGNRQEMVDAINFAHSKGKGLFAMKVFAGGNLLDQYDDALQWARSIVGISSFAIGVINIRELEMNLKTFGEESISGDVLFNPVSVKKMSILQLLCIGCGKCIEACPNDALKLENKKAVVSSADCVMCGYCTPHCAQLAIRLL